MKALCLSAVLLLCIGFSPVSQSKEIDEGMLTIANVRIEKIEGYQPSEEIKSLLKNKENESIFAPFSLEETAVILDQMIGIGTKLWKLVENNKPEVNASGVTASVVPTGVREWTELEYWQDPKTVAYRIVYENVYGVDVVTFEFAISFLYGGSYQGFGQYLSNVLVIPITVDVLWGYTFEANASIPSVFNMGSKEDPIAGMQIQVNWIVDTVLRHSAKSSLFHLQGDGVIKQH